MSDKASRSLAKMAELVAILARGLGAFSRAMSNQQSTRIGHDDVISTDNEAQSMTVGRLFSIVRGRLTNKVSSVLGDWDNDPTDDL